MDLNRLDMPGGAQGQAVVVLLSSESALADTAVAMAASVARAGRDTLHLVTIVNSQGGSHSAKLHVKASCIFLSFFVLLAACPGG